MKSQNIIKNTLITGIILVLAVVISLLFQYLQIHELIPAVFVFAVFLISLLTHGYIYGILSSLIGMLAVNYAFTYPYFSFDFILPINLISSLDSNTITKKINDYNFKKSIINTSELSTKILEGYISTYLFGFIFKSSLWKDTQFNEKIS